MFEDDLYDENQEAITEAANDLETAESEENGPCDSCEVSMINGVRCHEHGCPRYARLKRLRQRLEDLENR